MFNTFIEIVFPFMAFSYIRLMPVHPFAQQILILQICIAIRKSMQVCRYQMHFLGDENNVGDDAFL